jgi:hypothetical protein
VPVLDQPGGQAFQIRFRAATGGKSAPDKSYGKVARLHEISTEWDFALLGRNRHNTC